MSKESLGSPDREHRARRKRPSAARPSRVRPSRASSRLEPCPPHGSAQPCAPAPVQQHGYRYTRPAAAPTRRARLRLRRVIFDRRSGALSAWESSPVRTRGHRALIHQTGPVAERVRVREIDDDEGQRLVRIVRRGRSWAAISGNAKEPGREPRPRLRATYNRTGGSDTCSPPTTWAATSSTGTSGRERPAPASWNSAGTCADSTRSRCAWQSSWTTSPRT
jgi:hypothetical protein